VSAFPDCTGKSENRELGGLLFDNGGSDVVHSLGGHASATQRFSGGGLKERSMGLIHGRGFGWLAGLYRCDREIFCLVLFSIYGLFGCFR